jgi:hypothetical protein
MSTWLVALALAASETPDTDAGVRATLEVPDELRLPPERLHLLPPSPVQVLHTEAARLDPPPELGRRLSPRIQTVLGLHGHMMLLGSVQLHASTAARISVDGSEDGDGRQLRITPQQRLGVAAHASDRISFGVVLTRLGGGTEHRVRGTESRGMANLRLDFGP